MWQIETICPLKRKHICLQTYMKREELRRKIFSQNYLTCTMKVVLIEECSASPTEEIISQSHYMQSNYVKKVETNYQEGRNKS